MKTYRLRAGRKAQSQPQLREGGEEVGGGTECGVCMGVLRRWVDSVGDDDEDKDGG